MKKLNFMLIIGTLLCIATPWAGAQGTAFTYQGRLNSGGAPASGSYDLTFALFTDSNGVNPASGTLTNTGVGVTNGLFTVNLDFGPGVFNGESLWMQIGVETNGGGGFTTLSPLQQLTPAPYAVYSASANSATFAGQASSVGPGTVTAAGIAGGSVVKSLNGLHDAVTLAPGANVTITPSGNTLTIASSGGGGGGGSNAWSLTGNAGTSPASGNFLGTTDNNPLELHVNSLRALRLEPDGSGNEAPNVIGGCPSNRVFNGYAGDTIGGGGSSANPNIIDGSFGTIGGGVSNSIDNFIFDDGGSTIGGGIGNAADAPISTIGGGQNNVIFGGGSTISGGQQNSADGTYSVVAGGLQNAASMNFGGSGGTIGGGGYNIVNSAFATVSGGCSNTANGIASFAAGAFATANNNNSFVWGDGSRAASDTAPSQFDVLATGGAFFYTSTSGTSISMDTNSDLDFGTTTRQMLNLYNLPGTANNYAIGIQNGTMYCRCGSDVAGTGFAWYRGGSPNSGSFNNGGGQTMMALTTSALTVNGTFVSASDRNLKENFSAVDSRALLEKVSALPIQNWNYKGDVAARHIGPMAQDFYGAFGVGPDDKHIAVVDEGGVALAAIQGLNQKVEELSASLKQRDAENTELKTRLETIERMLGKQKSN